MSDKASTEVIQALIEALGDREWQVAHNAAKTLISIGSGREEVVAAFSKLATTHKDKKLRYYAIAGLGRLGGSNPVATKSLTRILNQDPEAIFRKAAVEGLGQLEMSDEIARTLAAALKDSDASVRVAAARVLARLNPRHDSVLQPRLTLPKELNSRTRAEETNRTTAFSPLGGQPVESIQRFPEGAPAF